MSDLPLGKNTKRDFAHCDRPMPEWLATFENKHKDNTYLVSFVQPKTTFQSLCPVTGQPDTASIEILYCPNELMVESKSLKEYLQSFRNSGEFHEDVVNRIANTLFDLLQPKYLRVYGDFVPRGDLAIKPMVEKWAVNQYDQDQIHNMVLLFDIKR